MYAKNYIIYLRFKCYMYLPSRSHSVYGHKHIKKIFFPEKLNTILKYAHTIYHVKIDFKPKFKVIKMYFVFCI